MGGHVRNAGLVYEGNHLFFFKNALVDLWHEKFNTVEVKKLWRRIRFRIKDHSVLSQKWSGDVIFGCIPIST